MSIAILDRLRRNFAPVAPAVAPVAPPRKLTEGQKAVRRGGELLTGLFPGWHRVIQLPELRIEHPEWCVLGQLGRYDVRAQIVALAALKTYGLRTGGTTYGAMAFGLGLVHHGGVVRHGFDFHQEDGMAAELTQAWREYITELRLA